ncbi:MAG: hypothetical protein M3Q48_03325, partial [Actinomycetota bacterium]|nr:hypothetical protein [Actinomycetota bacterium]
MTMLRASSERLRGAGALSALVAVVAAPPLVLARLGRPWPTRWPSLAELGDAMRSTDLPAGPVIKAVALIGWVAWAVVVAGVVVEIAARLRGGADLRRRSPSGPLQPLVAQLVATAMLLAPVVRPSPAAAHPEPAPAATQPAVPASAQAPVDGSVAALDAWRSGTGQVDLAVLEAAGYRVHLVERYESLARIAREQLDDEGRWPELWALNRGARQGDRRFTDSSRIYRGWRLLLPPTPPVAAALPDDAGDGQPASAPATTAPAGIVGLPAPPSPAVPRKSASPPPPVPLRQERTPASIESTDGGGRHDRAAAPAQMLGTAGTMLAAGVAAAVA